MLGPCSTLSRYARPALVRALCLSLCALLATSTLIGCGGSSTTPPTGSPSPAPAEPSASPADTSGAPFVAAELVLSPFDSAAAVTGNGASLDLSHLQEGYVGASATSPSRLKLGITNSNSDMEYHFDLPNDGTPISCPLVTGDGTYTFTVWENTSGNRYVELFTPPSQDVVLLDAFQPFLRPSAYCDYNAESESTQLAAELCATAENQGDAVRAIYEWIVSNISYDEAKAGALADATGYVPNPDATIADKRGICFDYASLAAAMLRSQGIPCKIITGYVSPDNIYHAWNMIYIDGTWKSARIDIAQNTWTRIDTTFAAGGASPFTGDGTTYTDRYTY